MTQRLSSRQDAERWWQRPWRSRGDVCPEILIYCGNEKPLRTFDAPSFCSEAPLRTSRRGSRHQSQVQEMLLEIVGFCFSSKRNRQLRKPYTFQVLMLGVLTFCPWASVLLDNIGLLPGDVISGRHRAGGSANGERPPFDRHAFGVVARSIAFALTKMLRRRNAAGLSSRSTGFRSSPTESGKCGSFKNRDEAWVHAGMGSPANPARCSTTAAR